MNKTQWGRETEGLTISLSTEKAVFESNDTIGLNISLKNTGPTPTAIVVRSPWIDYDISVRDENNNELPKSAYAQQMRETAAEGLRRTQQLMPGEELTSNSRRQNHILASNGLLVYLGSTLYNFTIR